MQQGYADVQNAGLRVEREGIRSGKLALVSEAANKGWGIMGKGHLETVRTYWAASALSDYPAAGACIGPGYVSIDHHKGVAYRTMEELLEAQAEDAAWSDRTFEITNTLETTDGALVVQVTISGRLNGYWCYLTGQGQRVTFAACVIFRFNEDGLIISEEHYSDALTVMKQLASSASGTIRAVTGPPPNWVDRTRPLWRVGNRIDALGLRHLGVSPMSLMNRGPVLVLETTGKRTGRRRFTPVGYWQDQAGRYLIGAGAAGMTRTPDWVANLRAGPRAAVWVRRSRIPVTVRELTGDERDEAQLEATRLWPGVPRYERMSRRVIPYFLLTPS